MSVHGVSGANGLERYGGFAGPADDTAVDELLDSLSILFTASASFDSEKRCVNE